jgi:hypothetical protein
VKLIDEKQKVIEQLERGLIAASQTEVKKNLKIFHSPSFFVLF